MKHIFIIYFSLGLLTLSCNETKKVLPKTQQSILTLKDGFKTPPLEAKPRALWCWVDGNFSLDEITNEMEEAVKKGIGGFDIWDVRKVVDEDSIVPAGPAFMSDAYLTGITHAINEAERLKLDLGLVIASGWNAGGKWTKPQHQTMGLYQTELIIKGGSIIDTLLKFPVLPEIITKNNRSKQAIIPKDSLGLPEYYHNIKVLAIPIKNDSITIASNLIIDVTKKMDSTGTLNWTAPKGDWKIIRYVCTNTGQPMLSSTPNSNGPMIDHFNPDAIELHLKYFIDKIEQKLGKPLKDSGLKHFYTDSYEVQGLLWTESLVEEFEKQMGYSMAPFIPVFSGYTIDNQEITNRFLYDYRKVWSNLIIDNHYKKATEICESHGIKFIAEAAGPGMPIHDCPFESLKSSGALSIPRGEFWHIPEKNKFFADTDEKTKQLFLQDLQVLKGVASASHIYDQKFVEAEAFTGTHIWVEGPGDLKATADRAFCEGLNRIIFHTWPHTPKNAGKPGWAYAFGTLMHENRIWWPKAKPWLDYLGRTSYLLQQGNFVGDVLYYYGDSVPNFVPAKHIDPRLGFGYDYDVTNTDVLVNKLSVANNNMTLPNGQNYKVLVLPDGDYMTLEVLKKIEKLVKNGATVIGKKPTKSPGLKDWKSNTKKVVELANKIWGDCDSINIKENSYGKGKIVYGKTIKKVLEERNFVEDFNFKGNVSNTNLDFIHRSTDSSEIYFIRNKTKQNISGNAHFRVVNMQPELWNPITGETNKALVFNSTKNQTILPVKLKPEESLFVVFTPDITNHKIKEITHNNQQIFFENNSSIKTINYLENSLNLRNTILLNKEGTYTIKTSNKTDTIVINSKPNAILLNDSWKLSFPINEDKRIDTLYNELSSWTKSNQSDIKFFSGIATYKKTFEVPENINLEDYKIVLTLGTVRDVAHVFINDKDAGISWSKPNIIDIGHLLKPNQNNITIEVANTWHNKLCGDARLPEDQRTTKSNITRLPNPWSYNMSEIPLKEDTDQYELQDAGMLGPVKIEFIAKYQFEL